MKHQAADVHSILLTAETDRTELHDKVSVLKVNAGTFHVVHSVEIEQKKRIRRVQYTTKERSPFLQERFAKAYGSEQSNLDSTDLRGFKTVKTADSKCCLAAETI